MVETGKFVESVVRVGERKLQIGDRARVSSGRRQHTGIQSVQEDVPWTWIGRTEAVLHWLWHLIGLCSTIP